MCSSHQSFLKPCAVSLISFDHGVVKIPTGMTGTWTAGSDDEDSSPTIAEKLAKVYKEEEETAYRYIFRH